MQALLATRRTPIVGDMGFSGSTAKSTVNSGENCNGGDRCQVSPALDVLGATDADLVQAATRGVELGFGRTPINGIGLGENPPKCEIDDGDGLTLTGSVNGGEHGQKCEIPPRPIPAEPRHGFVEERARTVDDPGNGSSLPKHATSELDNGDGGEDTVTDRVKRGVRMTGGNGQEEDADKAA